MVVRIRINAPNNTSKNAINNIEKNNTVAETQIVAVLRVTFLSSTRYATGTSVDEIVEVNAAIESNKKKPVATIRPIVPIELNSSGKI